MVLPSEPGIRRCHCCGWLFVSPDRARMRCCKRCKRGQRTSAPREVILHADELSVSLRQDLREAKF